MGTAVVVVHGVANRDQADFLREAGRLAKALEDRNASTTYAYWGNLAPARVERLAGLPTDEDEGARIGGGDSGFLATAPLAASPELVAELTAPYKELRGQKLLDDTLALAGSDDAADVVKEAIDEAMADGADVGIRPELAAALAEVVRTAPPVDSGFVDLDWKKPLKSALRGVLKAMDKAGGQIVSDAAANLLSGVRGALSPVVSITVGDILAYEKQGSAIRGVLDQAYAAAKRHADDVAIAAHSLGALITVEWLLGAPAQRPDGEPETPADERKVGTVVTFGAQVSVFSELHGLAGAAGMVASKVPLRIDANVDRWFNVWHHADPLAFVLGRALEVAARGTGAQVAITDVGLPLDGLPTSVRDVAGAHSSYWRDQRFVEWAADRLTGG